jgi:hypothetical protein
MNYSRSRRLLRLHVRDGGPTHLQQVSRNASDYRHRLVPCQCLDHLPLHWTQRLVTRHLVPESCYEQGCLGHCHSYCKSSKLLSRPLFCVSIPASLF